MLGPIASTSLILLLAAGCSSFDDDVFPAILGEPHIEFDTRDPDSLGQFDVDVVLLGGNRDQIVELQTAELIQYAEPHQVIPLDAAFSGFGGLVREDDEVFVPLVNVGTTAGELAPICRNDAFGIHIGITMRSDPGAENFNQLAPVDVTCR